MLEVICRISLYSIPLFSLSSLILCFSLPPPVICLFFLFRTRKRGSDDFTKFFFFQNILFIIVRSFTATWKDSKAKVLSDAFKEKGEQGLYWYCKFTLNTCFRWVLIMSFITFKPIHDQDLIVFENIKPEWDDKVRWMICKPILSLFKKKKNCPFFLSFFPSDSIVLIEYKVEAQKSISITKKKKKKKN